MFCLVNLSHIFFLIKAELSFVYILLLVQVLVLALLLGWAWLFIERFPVNFDTEVGDQPRHFMTVNSSPILSTAT